MMKIRMIVLAAGFTALMGFSAASGCEKQPGGQAPAGEAHDHAAEPGHGHGPTVDLGEQKSGDYTVKASRAGAVKAGAELSVDVDVTGGKKPGTVRMWVGTKDAKGSVKAKGEAEKDGGWHAHVEIPSPVPEGSKLWVELDAGGAEKTLVEFDLKADKK